MKKTLFIAFAISIFNINFLFAQASENVGYNEKIEQLELKISKIKALPKEEQKPYFALLSDVENRKNTLKSLLKTPPDKRDKTWEETWTQNYLKASGKLEKIQLK